jgi:hypothetical protein
VKTPIGSRQQELSSRRVLTSLETEVVPVIDSCVGESIKPWIVWPTWAVVEGTKKTILEYSTLRTRPPVELRCVG